MRPLTSTLLAAQKTPDALAAVTMRTKRRATFAGDPLAWRPLFRHSAANLPYADVNLTSGACACAQNGCFVRVLRSPLARKVGVQRVNALTWEGDGSAWSAAATAALTATPVQIGTLASTDTAESTPGVCRGDGSNMLAVWADGPKAYVALSTDDGVTWGAPALVYDGTGVFTRLSNFCVMRWPDWFWFVAFNGWTAAGECHVLGLYEMGGGWVFYGNITNGVSGWQVAGAALGPPGGVYVYLWGVHGGWNALLCQQWQGPLIGVLDRCGPAGGGAAFGQVRFGAAGGAYLFALQERAVNGYWFVSALFGSPGSLDMEEPVYLDGTAVQATNSETLTPLQAGRRAFLVGSAALWASAAADEPANLSVRSCTPISYTYQVATNGGGVLTAAVDRYASGADAPEAFGPILTPEIYVGDILWLDRSLNGQSMTLALRVVQVAYSRSRIDLIAADALGVLAHMRPRRAKVLAAGERTRMADVDAMCHWVGLGVTGSGTLPGAVSPSPGFTWPANDSGLGALRRYLADQVTALRSAGAGTAADQLHTTVELTPLPTTSSYTYVSPAGWAEEYPNHEIADWGLVLDGRAARLLAATGLAAAGDPLGDDGDKAWSITAARPLPGVRPYPLAAVDYSYAASDGRLQALSAAQAQWQLFGLPLGWIETAANLGVELYDVVTVDGTQGRVVGITETWERGRLRQRLDLAEVNVFGVSVG